MANILNASTSSGLVQTADTSGIIEFQASGSTKLTVNSSGATVPTATVTTLNAPTGVLATQNGMTGVAKAWVSYKGTATQSVRNSFNISSVTYNSTGDYTLNFTTDMPNANYAINGTTQHSGNFGGNVTAVGMRDSYTPTTTSVRISVNVTNPVAGEYRDMDYVFVTVFSS